MAEHGTFVWHDLVTTDQKKSGAFFSQLLGWTRKEIEAGGFGIYTLFQKQGQNIAGMMNPTPDSPYRWSHWKSYIAVDDVDGCAKCVPELGGKVILPPHDIPGAGRVCVVSDPTGAFVALMTVKSDV
jgi:predicted enzyme related to lactoylglutathione lyase